MKSLILKGEARFGVGAIPELQQGNGQLRPASLDVRLVWYASNPAQGTTLRILRRVPVLLHLEHLLQTQSLDASGGLGRVGSMTWLIGLILASILLLYYFTLADTLITKKDPLLVSLGIVVAAGYFPGTENATIHDNPIWIFARIVKSFHN